MDDCLSVSVLCCPMRVEAFEMGWSLVKRSPTKCLNKITKPPMWGSWGPYKDSRATEDDGSKEPKATAYDMTKIRENLK
jgi:hypothetical protein